MVAAYEELVRPRVMTAVEDLAARQASGVVEVTGSPSGAIYLDGGRIAFARASWVPGLAARLLAVCPQLGDLGGLSSGTEADDAAVAGAAVQRRYLSAAAVHDIIWSVVVDAFLVLTVPLAMDSPVAAIRFTSTRTYWTDLFPRFRADLVRGEALRRAERMAEHGLAPTTAVALRDLRRPAAVLTREQWAVACQIGDRGSALDLAERHGKSLLDTIDCLGGLTQAGLCTPVRVSGRAHGRAQPPGWSSHRGSPVSLAPGHPPAERTPAERVPVERASVVHLPAERMSPDSLPAPRLPARHPGQDLPPRPGGPVQSPSADILRQVLNGLRKLT